MLNNTFKLVTVSISNTITRCQDEIRHCEFYNLLSTFLSKNTSLRQIHMLLPMAFDAMSSMDAIQSGLDQNCTLETLTLNNKTIIFEKN